MELVRKIYSTLAGTRKDIEVTKGKLSKVDWNPRVRAFDQTDRPMFVLHQIDVRPATEQGDQESQLSFACASLTHEQASCRPGSPGAVFNEILRSGMQKCF